MARLFNTEQIADRKPETDKLFSAIHACNRTCTIRRLWRKPKLRPSFCKRERSFPLCGKGGCCRRDFFAFRNIFGRAQSLAQKISSMQIAPRRALIQRAFLYSRRAGLAPFFRFQRVHGRCIFSFTAIFARHERRHCASLRIHIIHSAFHCRKSCHGKIFSYRRVRRPIFQSGQSRDCLRRAHRFFSLRLFRRAIRLSVFPACRHAFIRIDSRPAFYFATDPTHAHLRK